MIPPNESSADSAPHDFIDAEMSVDGIDNPADEKTLSNALNGLKGIRNLSIAAGKVSVEYNPVEITKARLHEVIARSGFRVVDVASGPASTVSDALQHE